jgi:hypothetical protein
MDWWKTAGNVAAMIPGCRNPYTKSSLDRAYVAQEMGISEVELSDNLHIIKRQAGMIHGSSVWICLDDGNVYDPISLEYLGNVLDG